MTVIFASHILPWTVEVNEETGEEYLIPRARHSALFATSAKFAKHHVGITACLKPETLREFHRLKLNPVQVPKDILSGHYEGFCKALLWPLFHGYLETKDEGANRNWGHYVTVNQMIADEIVRLYEEGDTSMTSFKFNNSMGERLSSVASSTVPSTSSSSSAHCLLFAYSLSNIRDI
jgi:hypothetical protein